MLQSARSFERPFLPGTVVAGVYSNMMIALVLFMAGVLFAAPALAQEQPWDGPAFSADPKAVLKAAESIAAGKNADATMFLDERILKLDEKGRRTLTARMVYRVETAAGQKNWGSSSRQWEPWLQKQPVIQARVITTDGVVHELDPKTLSDAPAHQGSQEVYSDTRVYRGPLPAVAIGAIVEEVITTEDTQPYVGVGALQRFYLQFRVPVERTHIEVTAPALAPLRYTTRAVTELKVDKQQKDGMVRVTFDHGPFPAMEHVEQDVPFDVTVWPEIELTTVASWAAGANAYREMLEPQVRTAEVKALVAETIGASDSREEKIRKLTARLHKEVRYTGVEFGRLQIVPQPPSETLHRKYGDCKDKATVLVAMLREAGIPAYVALLRSGEDQDVSPEYPGMNLFNHAIVYVPGKPEMWIDATDEFSPAGRVPMGDQGRYALVIKEGTTALAKIPESRPEDNTIIESREFFLQEYGQARLVEETRGTGEIDRFYRSNFGRGINKNMRQQLESYVKQNYLTDDAAKIDAGDGLELTKPFTLRLEAEKVKRGNSTLSDAAIGILLPGITNWLPRYFTDPAAADDEFNTAARTKKEEDKTPARKNDFVMTIPFVTEWQYHVVAPAGFKLRAVPPASTTKMGPATLTQEYKEDKDGGMRATIRFNAGKRRYTAEEARALRKAVQELRSTNAVIIGWDQQGYVLMKAGKVREALESYRELARMHPKEALHHVQRANALIEAGLGEEARAEAKAATELDPQSAQAFYELGWVLEHDLIGRRLKKGLDIEGSISAFKKSLELDPKDDDRRADLAIILEHDANGERYTNPERVAEAVKQYRILKDNKATWQYLDSNMLYAMFHAHQYKELIEEAAKVETTSDRKGLVVAAVSAMNGSAAGLQKSLELTSGEDARAEVLGSAADLLLQARMYKEAADLMEKGISSKKDQAAAKELIEVLRHTVRREELKITEKDPAALLMKMFVFAANSDPHMLELFEAEDLATTPPKVQDQLVRAVANVLRNTMGSAGLTADAGADVVLSSLKPVVEVDKDSAMIKLSGLAFDNQKLYATHRSGEWRLVGFGATVPSLGRMAMLHLQKNDLAGARLWLDWARDEQKAENGEDPLGGPVFPRFWKKGEPGDADRIRIAAIAAMSGEEKWVKPYIADVKAAREKAKGASEKTRFDLLLTHAATEAEDWATAKEAAARLVEAEPDSDTAFQNYSLALLHLKEWNTFDAAAAARLKANSEQMPTVRLMVMAAERQGDMQKAIKTLEKYVDNGKAEAPELNNYAWDFLFTGAPIPQAAIDAAQKANRLTDKKSFAIIHTLACIYAELGRTTEARQLLLQLMENESLDEPNDAIWAGLGRIAEQYGETAAAANAYRRVEKPEKEFGMSNSTYTLAQQRLVAMNAKQGVAAGK